MIYAARQPLSFSCLQIFRPFRLSMLSNIIHFINIQCSHRKIIFLQIALYMAIFATLSLQLGLYAATKKSSIYVSAQVQSGSVRMVSHDEAQTWDAKGTGIEHKWLSEGDSILIKPGDRIEASGGVILLTYFDGSVQQVAQTNFTVPILHSASSDTRFSLTDWLMRLINGLNQPFRQSVTVASVLG